MRFIKIFYEIDITDRYISFKRCAYNSQIYTKHNLCLIIWNYIVPRRCLYWNILEPLPDNNAYDLFKFYFQFPHIHHIEVDSSLYDVLKSDIDDEITVYWLMM